MARLSLKLSQTNYLYTPTYFKIIEILTHDYLFSPSHLVSKTKACHCCDIKIFDAFEWHWSHSQKSIQDITYLLDITKEEKMKKKKNSSPYKLLLSDGRMEWVYRFVHDCFYFDNINDIKRGM